MIGYNESLTARTARKVHQCAEGRGCTIRPGQRYIRFVAFPGHEAAGDTLAVRKQCIGHALRYDDCADVTFGVCGSYCCAVEPCARPARHDGDHSCRNCPTTREAHR